MRSTAITDRIRAFAVIWAGVAALVLALLPALTVAAQEAATDFVPRVEGQRVYDLSGQLTSEQIAELEARADSLAAAGSDPVVYVRVLDAGREETFDQAEALLERWELGTAPGAEDGLVVLVNLDPEDLTSGEVVTFAGAGLQEGNLSADEQQRILEDDVLPRLRDDELAGGLAAALGSLEDSLVNGPPVSAAEGWARDAIGSWFNYVAGGLALLGAGITVVLWSLRSQGLSPASGKPHPTTTPPDATPPAVVGALLNGTVDHRLAQATVFALATRGALVIEPEPGQDPETQAPKVQLRLLDGAVARTDIERETWRVLEAEAERGIIDQDAIGELGGKWQPAFDAVRTDFDGRGWIDRDDRRDRNILYGVSFAWFVLAFAAFIVSAVAESYTGLIGAAVLLVVSIVALVAAVRYPVRTREGHAVARRWQGYRDGLKAAKDDRTVTLDLDAALPYAVAFGMADDVEPRLEAASAAGFVPSAFRLGANGQFNVATFIPMWVAINSTMTPSTSAATTTTTVTTSGSGGAGGSF